MHGQQQYGSQYCCYLVDIKEVQVLVDLAMISASGQGDLEVQKVSCLHSRCYGICVSNLRFKGRGWFEGILG